MTLETLVFAATLLAAGTHHCKLHNDRRKPYWLIHRWRNNNRRQRAVKSGGGHRRRHRRKK